METMDAIGAPARARAGAARVWAPHGMRLAWKHQQSKFALVLHGRTAAEYNALNRIWWEKQHNYRMGGNEDVPKGERSRRIWRSSSPRTGDRGLRDDRRRRRRAAYTPARMYVCARPRRYR